MTVPRAVGITLADALVVAELTAGIVSTNV